MTGRLRYLWLLVWALGNSACAAAYTPRETRPGNAMNTRIQLYQLIHDGDEISVTSVSHVHVAPGPQVGQETVTIEVEITEKLWGNSDPTRRSYAFERPDGRVAQLKFPDPVWGRVDLREGAQLLLVTPASSVRQAGPVYVDQIGNANDPVLKSIRGVLDAERPASERTGRFGRRMRWLTNGTAVEKLYAGEALARDGADLPEQEAQLVLSFAQVFAAEQDEYVKVSLGSWLWDYIYSHAGESGRVQILNATIRAATTPSELVSGFALDHLSESDPRLLRNPGIQSGPEVVRLLENRKAQETDVAVRHQLDDIIQAIRR